MLQLKLTILFGMALQLATISLLAIQLFLQMIDIQNQIIYKKNFIAEKQILNPILLLEKNQQ
jgi:hypothetical protein